MIADFTSLPSARLRLRTLAPADAGALLALYADADAMRYWSHAPWHALAQAQAAIGMARTEQVAGLALQLAIELHEGALLAGSCALYDIDGRHRRATLGYLMGAAHCGQGYASEAVGLLVAHGFAALGLRRIEAEVDARNAASSRLLARLGFRCEGRMHGRWLVDGESRDVDMWARLAGQ